MSEPETSRQKGPTEEQLEWATPRSTGGREVRIGIFVLLGVFSVLMVLFLLTDPATFRGRYIVATEVTDAGGIRRGDPVQMRGVNIGRVHRFEMVGNGVGITLEVDGRWSIPSDSRARLAGTDLLGGRTVEVIPGVSETALRPGDVMPGESVSGIMDMADVLGAEAQGTLERIQGLLDEETVASVRNSAGELEDLLESLADITREQRGELIHLTSSLSRTADRVEGLAGSDELERGIARADSTLEALQVAGENLARATRSMETVLDRIDRGEGTLGLLSTDESVYRGMTDVLEELGLLLRDVRENPGRYVRLRIF